MAGTNTVSIETVQRRIITVRGEKVMLDRDLADLYGVETKQLKRAVRRNIRRGSQSISCLSLRKRNTAL
jgi:hypothetical protein